VRIFQDSVDDLWVERADGTLVCVSEGVRAEMSGDEPGRALEDIRRGYGPLAELVPAAPAKAAEEQDKPSRYGRGFDDLAEQWATLEDGHDLKHPNRSQCGADGLICPSMRLAAELRARMDDWLDEWRARR
jgi:hypothetical protein